MDAFTETTGARARQRIQIGEWSVDPDTNRLTRGSESARIEPKAMDVLVLLARHAGQVVSREELFAAAWPGVVVGDEALTQTVIKLRRALGDSSRAPAYIETISKRGYRLIAPVREARADDADAGDETPSPPPATDPRFGGRARRLGLVAGLLLVAAAGGWLLHADAPAPPPVEPLVSSRQADWVSVTVLPFEWLGSDRDQDYLARGIGSDLMTALSRLSGLRVIRASSTDAPQPASGARYRVSGTVQRDAGLLRISVYLADTKTQEQLWAGRFERPYGDLFAIQDEITAKVVELLPGKVTDAERKRLAKRYTTSLEAYDCFLRGQASFLVRSGDENDNAREWYRKAVELDPAFARAYASLAMTYAMEYRLRPSADSTRALIRAQELAETARLIDADIPEVYWATGFVHAQGRRHAQAIEALRRAIRIDPSFADGYALLGGVHTYAGEPAQTIPLLRTAMRLNPDGGYLYFLLLGRAYLFEGDTEQALINLRAALLRNPVDVETHVYLAAALVAAGDLGGAEWEADEIRSLAPDFSVGRWLETYPMTSAPQRERLARLLASSSL